MNDPTPSERAAEAIRELGLTLRATFVPHSQSADKIEQRPSHKRLHWLVTIRAPGGAELLTPYSAGIGHLPKAIYNGGRITNDIAAAIEMACEQGKYPPDPYRTFGPKTTVREPAITDVMFCLITDADALEHPNFEVWAECFGYETDSRAAEATYRQCMELAVKLRYMVGEAGMRKLREAFTDY